MFFPLFIYLFIFFPRWFQRSEWCSTFHSDSDMKVVAKGHWALFFLLYSILHNILHLAFHRQKRKKNKNKKTHSVYGPKQLCSNLATGWCLIACPIILPLLSKFCVSIKKKKIKEKKTNTGLHSNTKDWWVTDWKNHRKSLQKKMFAKGVLVQQKFGLCL